MNGIETVICPVDFSRESRAALDLAIALCQRLDARLVVEHNVDPRPPNYMAVTWMWSEDHEAEEEEKAVAAGKKLAALFEDLPAGLTAEGKLTRGPIDLTVLHLARELPAGLIVMASHGRSTPEHQSLTERLIVEAPCPVLAAPQHAGPDDLVRGLAAGQEAGLEAVVPVEFEPHSLAAAQQAFDLARILPLRLHLLHVESPRRATGGGEMASDERRLRELVPEDLAERVTVDVEAASSTVAEILEFSGRQGASLMIVGTHPKGAVSRFFTGATSSEILHRSRWPVWFVPAGSAPSSSSSQTAGAVG